MKKKWTKIGKVHTCMLGEGWKITIVNEPGAGVCNWSVSDWDLVCQNGFAKSLKDAKSEAFAAYERTAALRQARLQAR